MEPDALPTALTGGAIGAVIGAAIGALLTIRFRRERGSRPARSPGPVAAPMNPATLALLDRAAQVMIAYGAIVDGAAANDDAAIREAVERLRRAATLARSDDGAPTRPARDAVRAFSAMIDETQTRIDKRLADGRLDLAAAEVRARTAALAQALGRLSDSVHSGG
ncbi:MAG: hypothetical protein EPO26_07425 [Chloroflexota bacterium]|nr:MAG: hypothetical protein EPO26_07425 [Chloroflexota bacterium]